LLSETPFLPVQGVFQQPDIRLLKNSIQRASLRLNRGLAEDKVTHRLGDRSGDLLSEIPFLPVQGFFNSLICAVAAVTAKPAEASLLALLHDTGLRVSEAAALEWPDVERDSDGQAGTVTVRSGKIGARIVAVSARAVRALSAIRPANAKGSVFGVSESQLHRRVKSAAKAVGAEGVTSHGGRVGMAQTMARNGAAAPAIMRQGGWSWSAMVARYIQKLSAKEAVRFL